jgi:Ca2+-binding RTX toxin-like protein
MIGRVLRATRRIPAVAVACITVFAFDAVLLSPGNGTATAVANGPTLAVFGGGGMSLVDSPGHSAIIAIRQDPDRASDAIIASNEHLNVGAGCKYLWQTDLSPYNDTAPGYDLWVRCANVTGQWVLFMLEGADQVSVSHPTRTTNLTNGKNIQILAGTDNDTITILDGTAEVWGEAGNDVIRGGPKDDVFHGGPGFDELTTGLGKGPDRDEMYGDEGNDTLVGGRDRDILDGGSGLDILAARGARDTLNARDGEADEINCGGDSAVADILRFDPGVDKLFHCAAEKRRNPSGT